jgi:hypothetical protein
MALWVLVFVLLLGVLAWLFLGGRDEAPEPTARRRVTGDIDYAELEQAEREVREASDEESVRDWGPGASPPPPPPPPPPPL